MDSKQPLPRRNLKHTPVWLELLGSMNLAITLLVAIAIASVVGTVLQQNQPYQDYIIKFGPFWFDVFKQLGLFDVYAASWFLAILTFLVLSTSTCIYRNAPTMLHDMRSYRLNVQRTSLNAFHHRREWLVDASSSEIQSALKVWLGAQKYRHRSREGQDFQVLAAMKGGYSRLGYIFTHVAIVVICIGALFDGNVPLKMREMAGELKPETRDLSASDVPAISRLSLENPSFRGSVNIPEGTSADLVFLQMRDGFLVQPLPFSVEVKDFRIEHYASGQPKSFESDLVITDPDLEMPLESTISVNHPLIYKGYSIYQASFSDGGTGLSMLTWPLHSGSTEPQEIQGKVFKDLDVQTLNGTMTLEFTNFRMFNINPVVSDDGKIAQKNFGPNFTYKLRNVSGQALEYENYMLPIDFKGRMFFLSGVRESPAEPFQYLHIPVDPAGGMERFQRFNALLYDDERVLEVARRTIEQSLNQDRLPDPKLQATAVQSMQKLVAQFREGGFDAISEQVENNDNVPKEKLPGLLNAYFKVLQTIAGALYVELLTEEGIETSQGMSETDALFFDEALNAVSSLGAYRSPFYLQLTNYDFVQSSGLQITRAPGKNVVYLGFALLIAGVFMMLYVPGRRMWFWIDHENGHTRVLAAGTGNRHPREFEKEFERLCGQLDQYWRPNEQKR